MIKKILVTGGDCRFAQELKKNKNKYIFIPGQKQLDILSIKSFNNIRKFKPDCLLHLAALSRPMSIHDREINKSINLNVIELQMYWVCNDANINYFFYKLRYPGKKGIIVKMILTTLE